MPVIVWAYPRGASIQAAGGQDSSAGRALVLLSGGERAGDEAVLTDPGGDGCRRHRGDLRTQHLAARA